MQELVFDRESSKELKHYGIVSAMVDELGIVEIIDKKIPMLRNRKNGITRGQIVKALIINTLGFAEQRLYLVADFFKGIPVKALLGDNVTAEKLNDDIIGRCLDDICEYGVRKLITEVSMEILAKHPNIKKILHVDTTSISVEGEYKDPNTDMEGIEVKITYGHSKDKRPDLKQFIYSLMTVGAVNMPLSVEVLDGNSSDKKNLSRLIDYAKQFYEEAYNQNCPYIFVADSAFYNKDMLLSKDYSVSWITRVPETLKRAKEIVEREYTEWEKINDNYSMIPIEGRGDSSERWILIESKAAKSKESKTLERNLIKKASSVEKAIADFSKEVFHCEKDALKALKKLKRPFSLYYLELLEMVTIYGNDKVGRPKKGCKKILGYSPRIKITRNEAAVADLRNSCGRFILGTNVKKEQLSNQEVFNTYKEQAQIESCFRFLKSPSFFASDIYIKKNGRIEALMAVVTIAIMIYNASQFHIRQQLKIQNGTFPNQVGKGVQNPTARWIFQCFKFVKVARDSKIENMNESLAMIVSLFGLETMALYRVRGQPAAVTLNLE
jgi:transposase